MLLCIKEHTMKTIAVIDDDIYIGDLLEELLTGEGYAVIRAYSGTEALLMLEKTPVDLVLLDLMLPGLSGEQVMERLEGTPVIVLSAKAGTDDKVKLLLSGAHDYVTKPFDNRELLARISVQLREEKSRTSLKFGDLSLNSLSHEVSANGEALHLTRTEYAVLKLLMDNPGQVVAKSAILDGIFEDTPDCTESSLKIHISNLRKKLRDAGARESIEAVWGIGFRLKQTGV